VAGILEALERIFNEGKKSDQVVPALLKAHPKWGSRDRNFVAENTYEIVRNKVYLDYLVDGENNLRKVLGTWLILKGGYALDHEIFEGLDSEELLIRAQQKLKPEIRFSIDETLSRRAVDELGEDRWYRELEAMHTPAPVFIRVNLQHVSVAKLKQRLEEKGILTETVPGVPTALKITKRSNLQSLEEYQKGWFEIQDAGSQCISTFLGVNAGEFIIDACAGAGGKTLHLADMLGKKGSILALDVEEYKLKELERRVQRNKVKNVQSALWSPAMLEQYKGKADAVLMDVPCSGLGVLRRNPDAKYALTVDFLDEIRGVQKAILKSYSTLLKPGGRLVYATCSLLPSENARQVAEFLAENPAFSLVKEQQIWPSETHFDGFYMALLK
jgi:16S rRNA (cytosine967-C5)-methyltransferase